MSLNAVVREAAPHEAPKVYEWLMSTPNNLFDPASTVWTGPSLRTIAVDLNKAPALYIPFHPVLMVESLAHDPEITPRKNAYALLQAQKALESLARTYGMSELYWMCGDQSLIDLAVRRGYEVVNAKVLRKKVDLQ